MLMKKMKNTCIAFLLIASSHVFAQRNFTLYQFQNTHQSLQLNPAFRPNIKNYASSGVGSFSVGMNHTGFTINDLLIPRAIDDSLEFDIQNAISKMTDVNSLSFDLQNELFGLGIRAKKTHLMFSVVSKNQFSFFYPKDLFRFVFEGNGASLLGQRASLDGLGFKLNSYMEYGAGANRTFLKDKLSVGARIKLLSGIYNAHTSRSELGIYTNDSTFDITIDGAVAVQSSYLNPLLDRNYFAGISSGFNFRNIGFGLDLGATYNILDRIEISASVIDLGFIKWNANNRNFVSDDVNFTFEGINLNQFLADSSNYFKNFADSIRGAFNGSQNTDSYTTSLNTRFFVGTRMKIAPTIYGNALLYNEFILGNYAPGFSIGGTFQLKEALTLSTNYTIFGRFAKNLGVGLNLRAGSFQFFAMTDNLLGIINLKGSKNWHANIGISASIGRPDKDKKAAEKDIKE